MTGRLTLSWANKDKALLSLGKQGYEWVDRDDPRVREVRLLDEVGAVGEALPELVEGRDSAGGALSKGSTSGARDNLLIRGDSVDALRALVRTPEHAEQYRGKVKLVYIDPPFNTGQAFEHYDDSLEHSVWLGMMRERLVLIRELLAPDGSVWVHLDDAEMAYCRVLMDEIFGRQNFIATMVWQKRYSRENRSAIGGVHDYLMVFAPLGSDWKLVRNRIERTSSKEYRNPNSDPRGDWRAIPLDVQAGHATLSQFYDVVTPGGKIHRPSTGRAWSVTEPRMQQLRDAGLVYFGKDGNGKPNLIRYLDEDTGLVPWTWWPHEEVGHNDEAKKEIKTLFPEHEPFDTPKPERLLKRIIEIGSNPGDIVLDCFAGSGTTAAVAHKMGRRWVTVELSENTADTFTKPRLQKVVNGEDPGGITEGAGWAGGGGFRDLRVQASVWDVISDDLGTAVFQAPDVDSVTMARSVAAQLGYRLIEPVPGEPQVFVGAKGRSRLAVASGVVDAVAVADIVSALADGETAVIAALSHTEDAATTLAELSRGSRIVRMPSQLFPALGKVTR